MNEIMKFIPAKKNQTTTLWNLNNYNTPVMCQCSCPKDLISSDSKFVLIDAPNTNYSFDYPGWSLTGQFQLKQRVPK